MTYKYDPKQIQAVVDWQKRNPEKVKAYKEKSKTTNPYHYINKIFLERRRQAFKKNVPFDIVIEDVRDLVPTHCPILGIELYHGSPNNEHSPSLDRIVPQSGYTKSNVHWISNRANRLKADADWSEIQKLYEWFKTNTDAPTL